MSKNKELVTQASEEQLAELRALYPQEDTYQKIQVPRLGMLAKDVIEEEGTGKAKTMKVVNAMGEFYIEKEATNDDGEKVWLKTFVEGDTIDVQIVYNRKQLSMWDDGQGMYTNTPIYDSNDEVLPLWEGGKEIARDTPEKLQARYPALTQKGKPSSKLKEIKILYVIYEGETYQVNLSQSSKWEFLTYSKKTNPATVVTTIGSTEETNGTNTYRKMSFVAKSLLSTEQAAKVIEAANMIRSSIESEKAYYGKFNKDVTSGVEEDWTPDEKVALGDGKGF